MYDQVRFNIRDIALIGIISATITAGKLALSFIPNVEIVTLLFILYTTSLGTKRTLLAALIFSTTEILIYGFATWLLGYYIFWPLLILITGLLNKKIQTEYGYAFLAGIFGLLFGAFFALVESLFYGYMYGFSYWIRGLPFDVVHGVSNFIIVLLLYRPLSELLRQQFADF
ncbi:MAG: hypothetical protein ACOC2G_01985 [Bacillota bacterium]